MLPFPLALSDEGAQTADKPCKRKNSFEQREIRRNFCLLRQPHLQPAVTYVHVSSLVCKFASLPCKFFQRPAKRRLCQRFETERINTDTLRFLVSHSFKGFQNRKLCAWMLINFAVMQIYYLAHMAICIIAKGNFIFLRE